MISLANYNEGSYAAKQSDLIANICSQPQGRENAGLQVPIASRLAVYYWSILRTNHGRYNLMRCQNKRVFFFDSPLKTIA